MRGARVLVGAALALTLASCSGKDSDGPGGGSPATGTQVGCEWFAKDNCWKTAVAEANACVDGTLTGSVSADSRTCSYTDGTSIVFSNPLSEESSNDDYVWDFNVARNGQSCASFKELGPTGEGGFSISAASGEVREDSVGLNLVFSCPSGERVQIGFSEAFSCLESMPGIAWSGSGTSPDVSVSFSFLGGASSEELFHCSSP